MPMTTRTNAEGDEVPTYVMPLDVALTDTLGSDCTQHVKEHRKFYAQATAELVAVQKQFSGKDGDRDAAREIRDFVKHFAHAERAATLVISMFDKGTTMSTRDFPHELADLLDYEFNTLMGPDYFKETL